MMEERMAECHIITPITTYTSKYNGLQTQAEQLKLDTSGEDGSGIDSHQMEVQPAVDVREYC